MTVRYAVYYAPDIQSELWELASQWLGRDAALPIGQNGTAATWASSLPQGLATKIVSPSRYGFHATLKPPMRLVDGKTEADLVDMVEQFSLRHSAVELGELSVANISGFLALVPTVQREPLLEFAADVVRHFEPLRAELTAEQFAKRMASPLTPRQLNYLNEFGYPYIFDEFRFHMTLTDRLNQSDVTKFKSAAEAFFAGPLSERHMIDRLVVYKEERAGEPFRRIADFPLGISEQRKVAS